MTDYVRLGGKTIAELQNGVPTYLYPDHLGTPVVGADQNRNILWRDSRTPFGEKINPVAARENRMGYTGHIEDDALKLTYMQARYYDPVIGRFMSNDPVGFASGGVGYFNRYAYVMNNPVNAVDPDGRVVETFWDAANVIYGIGSAGVNAWNGNWGAAALDLGGAALDAGATLIPGVPGGATAGIQATRKGVNALDSAGDAAKAAKAGCCFVAGTEILTDRGMVPIEQIREGDLVMATNPDTGETTLKPVVMIFVNDEDTVWNLVVETPNGASEVHRVTNNHPYWVTDAGWVEVSDLKVGMLIRTLDGEPVKLVSVEDTGLVERTFNFEVADFHTYFVGDQNVLVHNCSTIKAFQGSSDFLNKGAHLKGTNGIEVTLRPNNKGGISFTNTFAKDADTKAFKAAVNDIQNALGDAKFRSKLSDQLSSYIKTFGSGNARERAFSGELSFLKKAIDNYDPS